MRVLVVTTQVPLIYGGAEIHSQNLVNALREFGHQADQVALPYKWYPAEKIVDHILMARLVDLTEASGVPIDRVIGLKFPAYLVSHPNKVLWILHQHRSAYEMWGHPEHADLMHQPAGNTVRAAIEAADRRWIPEAKRVFANSNNVAKRLKHYCDIDSTPLYHPPAHAEHFYQAEPEPYLFFPSRIDPMKRQWLVVEALAHVKQAIKVKFSGTPDRPEFLSKLQARASELGVAERIEWCGFVDDQKKRDLYAHCLAVVYPPVDEDYGYITLEGMLAGKPVLTTQDAGGPLEFIEHGVNGLVCEPSAAALAAAMDEMWSDFSRAVRWGKAGRERYLAQNISWRHVVEQLLA